MNIVDLLPTKKVTAFLLGGAIAMAILWILVDVVGVLDEWPAAPIVGAWTIILGFILAWVVPESAWQKAQAQTDE
jgi:hypothetical protein